MEDLERARERWLIERPQYEAFGDILKLRLEAVVRRLGLPATISCRAKEIDSLLKKLISKPVHTYESLGDKLGARIILKRKRHVDQVCDAVKSAFICGNFEDKADKLKDWEVGYLSMHVDISLLQSDSAASDFSSTLFKAELQVRTLAQNVWSEMAHDTAYKSGNLVVKPLKRRLYVLAGLIEVADAEYDRLDEEIANLPDMPELRILKALERYYYRLTARRGDMDLSLQVIRLLWPLYEANPDQLNARFEERYSQDKTFLEEVYQQAEKDPSRSAFFFQPESLLIYDQLATMQSALRQRWVEEFPEKELERLAVKFGFSFD